MNFDFKNVPEDKKYVGYGINNSVTIISVESGVAPNEKKTPFIQINLKITGDTDDNSTIQKLYVTEKSQVITMRKIMAIHSAVNKLEILVDKNFESLDEMAKALNSMWSGRKLRLKLQAEEYLGTDKDGNPKTKYRTSIPMFDFVEAIAPGADMPVVADADTKLKFDKNNPNDFKRLDPSEAQPDVAPPPVPAFGNDDEESEGGDDMPF